MHESRPQRPARVALFALALTTGLLAGFCLAAAARAADDYQLGPDSQRQSGVPEGTVTEAHWTSKIFPGTERDYFVYVPQQYDGSQPACVMVFQDGRNYVDTKKDFRVPIVFDNLIAKGEMPVTIGIFINPGVIPAESAGDKPRENRSFEYDSLGDQYADFLLREILPEVGKKYKLTSKPEERAICGISSGGICAWTVAWERPEAFRKVLSHVGSFTNIRGGHVYPALIRKTERKPIRVFLQDGSGDLDNAHGKLAAGEPGDGRGAEIRRLRLPLRVWRRRPQRQTRRRHPARLASLAVERRRRSAGQELTHGRARGQFAGRVPSLRIARTQPAMSLSRTATALALLTVVLAAAASAQNVALPELLIPGQGWEQVAEGFTFTEGPAVDPQGRLYFTDVFKSKIHRLNDAGEVETFVAQSGGTNGLMFGPDGRLYGCQNGKKRIVAYDSAGHESAIAEDVKSNDLVVNAAGAVYFTDPENHQVWYIAPGGQKKVVDRGLGFPNGLVLWPDQKTLVVADMRGANLWAYRCESDGSLSFKQPFYTMELPTGKLESGADGMTFDSAGPHLRHHAPGSASLRPARPPRRRHRQAASRLALQCRLRRSQTRHAVRHLVDQGV